MDKNKKSSKRKTGNGYSKREPRTSGSGNHPTPLKKVASGFFAGVPNAGAETIVFNNKLLNQSIPSVRAGVGNAGIHIDLAYALDTDGIRAFQALTDVEFATLNRYAGHDLNFDAEDYRVYRSLTFMLDACIQEARRDLLMFKWRDVYSIDAFADYWGPSYDTVLDQLPYLPEYRVKYANLAARAATSYPHTTMPIGTTLEYLLGNVFLDDSTGKAHYIYFHLFNNSLLTSEPSINHCITSIQTILDTLDQQPNVSAINAAVVKAYGSEAYRDYMLVTDDMGITPIFDVHLINALNNISNEPRIVGDALPLVSSSTLTEPTQYDDGIVEVCNNCVNFGYPMKRIYDEYPDTDAQTTITMLDKLEQASSHIGNVPRLYFGPDFQGEAAVGNLFFTAHMSSIGAVSDLEGTFNIQHYLTSAHGIIAVRGWTNQRISVASGVVKLPLRSIIFDFSYLAHATGNDFTLRYVDDSRLTEMFEAVRQVELVDAGNITIFLYVTSGASPIGMVVRNTFSMAERVDDYAVVDNLSYQLVKDSVLNSYFDNGSARFIEPRTSTVINYSAVK